ncbi:MAG: hypothetical protein J0M11_03660 [Anaerolineae bacterium]|nr:hypothetical protein [Anaerolineae bacterium]
MKLETIFKTLGLPLALIAVIVALLNWAGLDIERIYAVAVSLVGFQLLGFVLIDALKYAGVVTAGDSGKWSAVYNLITLVGVAVYLGFAPSFDISGLDAQVYELAKVLGILLAYVSGLTGTKGWHLLASRAGVTYSFPAG